MLREMHLSCPSSSNLTVQDPAGLNFWLQPDGDGPCERAQRGTLSKGKLLKVQLAG